MATRAINATERYLLTNYQRLMSPADRMIARSLVEADFDVGSVPRAIWDRVSSHFPGVDGTDTQKLAIQICLRLLHNHRDTIRPPTRDIPGDGLTG